MIITFDFFNEQIVAILVPFIIPSSYLMSKIRLLPLSENRNQGL